MTPRCIEDELRASLEKTEQALREANAKIAMLSKGEWFYDAEDGENSAADWNDLLENLGEDGPLKVGGAREVERFWIARVVLTRDEDGDPDETEIRRFDTMDEARAALLGGQSELPLEGRS